MKKTILSAAILPLAALFAVPATAADELVKIEFKDGTVQTYNVNDIREITFGDKETPETIAGIYSGITTVVVGGTFSYDSGTTDYDITEEADGTLTVKVPSFVLTGTVMGDLTLGEYTLSGLKLNEATGAYELTYGGNGQTVHFKAEQNGTTTMENDYEFKEGCKATVEQTETGITLKNDFQIGNMPFPLALTFNGVK